MRHRLLAVFTLVALVMTIAVPALAAPPPWAGGGKDKSQGHGSWRFQDMGEATWAARHVYRLALNGVVNGRGGGKFAPGAPVKRCEALAMVVRALGDEDEAADAQGTIADELIAGRGFRLKDRFKDASGTPEWSWGYVEAAAAAGLLEGETLLCPNAPASRLWVAVLLVRALDMTEGLEDYADVALGFKDASAIPQGYQPYVALVADLGLITGYPNGTFHPNKPVTRAEMAVLIGRMLEVLGDEALTATVFGVIRSVEMATDSDPAYLVVKPMAGPPVTLAVAEDAAVYYDGEECTLADLEAGLWVKATMEDGAATLIEASTRARVEGIVTAVGLDDDPVTIAVAPEEDQDATTYTVADDVVVLMGRTEVGIEDVEVGDSVLLEVVGSEVTKIRIQDRDLECIEAVVVSVDADAPSITCLVDEEEATFDVADTVSVRWGWRTGYSLEDLLPGDEVELKLQDDKVYEINIEDRQEREFLAVVAAVSVDDMEITVTSSEGEETLPVDEDVVVCGPGGAALTLEDLEVNDVVELRVVGGVVYRIKVEEPAAVTEAEGLVADVDPETETFVIQVERDLGDGVGVAFDVTVSLAEQCEIEWNGEEITAETLFEALAIGDEAKVEGAREDGILVAREISITSDTDLGSSAEGDD